MRDFRKELQKLRMRARNERSNQGLQNGHHHYNGNDHHNEKIRDNTDLMLKSIGRAHMAGASPIAVHVLGQDKMYFFQDRDTAHFQKTSNDGFKVFEETFRRSQSDDMITKLVQSVTKLRLTDFDCTIVPPGKILRRLFPNVVDCVMRNCKNISALKEVVDLDRLERLKLYNCPEVDVLPRETCKMRNLKKLTIDQCPSLNAILPEHYNLPNLQFLELTRVNISRTLVASVGTLTGLKELEIHMCPSLEELPQELMTLVNLEHLRIEQCQSFNQITSDIGKLSNLKKWKIMFCNNLRTLPPQFGKLDALQHLHIYSCSSFEGLPREISRLSSLQFLGISNCPSFRDIPEEIGMVASLVELQIRRCRSFENVPASIASLKNLRSLELSLCDSFGTLPDIGSLTNLKQLDIKSFANGVMTNISPLSISRLPPDCVLEFDFYALGLGAALAISDIKNYRDEQGERELKFDLTIEHLRPYFELIETFPVGIAKLRSLMGRGRMRAVDRIFCPGGPGYVRAMNRWNAMNGSI